MIGNTLCLFTGFLGIIIFSLMIFRFKNNRHINTYFLILVFLCTSRFLSYGLTTYFPVLLSFQKQINYSFALNAWPLIFLYYKNLTQIETSFKNRDLLHFVAPIFIVSMIWCKNYLNSEFYSTVLEFGMIFSIAMGFIYSYMCYQLLKKHSWNRISDIAVIDDQNKLIRQWTQFSFAVMIISFISFLLNIAMNKDLLWFKNQNQQIWVGAVVWILIYLKMLHSPEILYGYQKMQQKITEHIKSAIVFDEVWDINGKEILNIQDVSLKEKIMFKIENYILGIEHLALNSDIFLVSNFKLNDLARKLDIPKSHVLYIFKYHSKLSFSDFRKIIRIQKSILLMKENYLNTNTMESLSEITGFISYSNFFKSFKSITGVSPKDYDINQ
jgi:AraC-like DNA-binding protein